MRHLGDGEVRRLLEGGLAMLPRLCSPTVDLAAAFLFDLEMHAAVSGNDGTIANAEFLRDLLDMAVHSSRADP